MRLRETIAEAHYQGRAPVIPFFPFPKSRRQEGFDFLVALGTKSAPAAIGLVYPGRRVLASYPPFIGEPDGYWEWELFQFVYALTHQTGVPVVLAIHYLDILRFGIIPYGQEGHAVGLDTLLVTGLAMDGADGFAIELAANGVGLAYLLDEGLAGPEVETFARQATSFLYLPRADEAVEAAARAHAKVRLFQNAAAARFPHPPGDRAGGWVVEAPLGPSAWDPDWRLAGLPQVLDRLEVEKQP